MWVVWCGYTWLADCRSGGRERGVKGRKFGVAGMGMVVWGVGSVNVWWYECAWVVGGS